MRDNAIAAVQPEPWCRERSGDFSSVARQRRKSKPEAGDPMKLEMTTLLVQNHDSGRLSSLLTEGGIVVRTCTSLAEIVDANKERSQNSCLIIDLQTDLAIGLTIQESLMSHGVSLPILFVVDREDKVFRDAALKAGAVDVLCHPVDANNLKVVLEEAILSEVVIRSFLDSRSHFEKIDSLTSRQKQIVYCAARGLPNKTIAARLNIHTKTVEKQRQRAYEKLGVDSLAEMSRVITLGTLHSALRGHRLSKLTKSGRGDASMAASSASS